MKGATWATGPQTLRFVGAARSARALWALRALRALWTALTLCLIAPQAWAHKSSDAYLTIQRDAEPAPASTAYRLHAEVALRDLDRELTLDANDDAALTWAEVRGRWPDITALVRQGVELSAAGQVCQSTRTSAPQLADRSDGTYAVLEVRWLCEGSAAAPAKGASSPSLRYSLFQRSDAGHRGLLLSGLDRTPRVLVPGGDGVILGAFAASDAGQAEPEKSRSAVASSVLDPIATSSSSALSTTHRPSGFWSFVFEGMHHIAVGLDHILFLLTLVVVAVFTRQGKRWLPQITGRAAVVETLRIVTAFTVAHSITLGLAAAGWLTPPSRLVESVIALSVLLAATDNLRQLFVMPRWAMAGLFGLFHGFGFATPLQDLGLQGTQLLVPLFAFNLGVELGQLAIVALVLPLAINWRRSPRYQRHGVPGFSLAVALLAGVWLLERSLNLTLLGL
jgi:hydrogenase/urease accessory protein HupE